MMVNLGQHESDNNQQLITSTSGLWYFYRQLDRNYLTTKSGWFNKRVNYNYMTISLFYSNELAFPTPIFLSPFGPFLSHLRFPLIKNRTYILLCETVVGLSNKNLLCLYLFSFVNQPDLFINIKFNK